ncbi:hypothetical protein [Treponema primitia]|uniref:hypothetical protein n=1 Tax=Treponema primitia TaxID=88058 RepID=UPI0002FA22CD|nr:hypothetical protein [Treponema primitia]
MADTSDYLKTLTEVLAARADWLEKSELPKLKEEFRTFHTAFVALYKLFLKKGLIIEDPYKNEVKIGELEVPETAPFAESDYKDEYSLRLSSYDNQLDFLVNFYQFSVDFLTVEKIKRILGLVRFVDWTRLSNNSEVPNNKAMMEILNAAKAGADPLSASIINESLSNLSRTTGSILSYLKLVSDYNREAYKLELRTTVLSTLTESEASVIPTIRKKFATAMPGKPFYPDLVAELVKEDSNAGKPLRDEVIKQMTVPDTKPKTVSPQILFKGILIEGLNAIGSVGSSLTEVGVKMDENAALLENRKNGFWDKLKRVIQQMLNKEPDPTIFDVEYMDPVKGGPVKEKVDFAQFRGEMDRKTRTLTALASRSGGAFEKMQSMNETQLMGMLEKNIREVQTIHKVLGALDDFFKIEAGREDRDKVKGIKPELATMKNAIVKANQRRHEYSAQKEEEEQMRKLGISSGV